MEKSQSNTRRLTFFEVLWSTLAAAFGVQTRRNMQRDFDRGDAMYFIIAGLIFTVVFVLTIVGVVAVVTS